MCCTLYEYLCIIPVQVDSTELDKYACRRRKKERIVKDTKVDKKLMTHPQPRLTMR